MVLEEAQNLFLPIEFAGFSVPNRIVGVANLRAQAVKHLEPLIELLAKPQFRNEIQRRLNELSRSGTSATTRVTRAVLIPETPGGIEITDKNTLSFSGVMKRREAEIRALYSGEMGDCFLHAEAENVLSKTR